MACSSALRCGSAIPCADPDAVRYSEHQLRTLPVMRASLSMLVLFLALAAAPLAADARSDAKKHVEFGVTVAQKGLWREAILQWERAAQIDPTYAAAQNNLAIAYEHEGDLDKARGAYEKALAIEPNNQYIKQNYELFKEINDRRTSKDGQ